jgi:regulator of replication initiation timing
LGDDDEKRFSRSRGESVERRTSSGGRPPLNAEQQLFCVVVAHHCTPMGCGTSTPVHPEGGAETDAMQALAQQIAALRSENDALQQQLTSTRSENVALQQRLTSTRSESVALQEHLTSTRSENVALQQQLTSTRSQLADDKQTIVALQEQLTSTRSQLAGALTREQVVTGRLAFFVKVDKDEKDLAERIAKLKLELAELQTSASSASQLSTSAQAHPAASPAQALGDTPVDAAVFEVDPTKSAHAALDFRMRLGLRIAAGPEDFFALADTKDDKLSPQGWLEACKSSLGNVDEGNVDEALCRSLFDEMVIYIYIYI